MDILILARIKIELQFQEQRVWKQDLGANVGKTFQPEGTFYRVLLPIRLARKWQLRQHIQFGESHILVSK